MLRSPALIIAGCSQGAVNVTDAFKEAIRPALNAFLMACSPSRRSKRARPAGHERR